MYGPNNRLNDNRLNNKPLIYNTIDKALFQFEIESQPVRAPC